jgi:hypothetical protein
MGVGGKDNPAATVQVTGYLMPLDAPTLEAEGRLSNIIAGRHSNRPIPRPVILRPTKDPQKRTAMRASLSIRRVISLFHCMNQIQVSGLKFQVSPPSFCP